MRTLSMILAGAEPNRGGTLKRLIKTIAGFALTVTGALTSLTPAEAHHSFAMYDTTKPATVTGIVTRTSPDAFHFQIFIAQLNMERTKVLAVTQ